MRRPPAPVIHVLGDVVNDAHVCARCGHDVFEDFVGETFDRAEVWANHWPVGTRVFLHRDGAGWGVADCITVTRGRQPRECGSGLLDRLRQRLK